MADKPIQSSEFSGNVKVTRESLSSLRMIQQPSVAVGVTLYCNDASIYSASVKIALAFKRVPYTAVHPPDGYGSAAYKAIVPTGKIPAIIHNDFTISESSVVMEYLEETFCDLSPPLLYHKNPAKNALTRYAQRLHDLYLEPALRSLFPHIDPAKRDKSFVDAKYAIIHEQLADLERVCDSHGPFYCGEQMTFADCVLPGTLMVLEMFTEEFYGTGIDYMKKYRKLGSVRETHLNHFAVTSVLITMKEATHMWIKKVKEGAHNGHHHESGGHGNTRPTTPQISLPPIK